MEKYLRNTKGWRLNLAAGKSLIVLCCLLTSCQQANEEAKESISSAKSSVIIADTIIYDVFIKAENLEDAWEIEKTEDFRYLDFTNLLFQDVYAGKYSLYDYFEDYEISVDELRLMEQEGAFNRDNIGKIQFTERWHYDTINHLINKEIISFVPGYTLYADDGSVRGYKPLFLIRQKN